MTAAVRSMRRAVVLVAAVGTFVVASPAQAQIPDPGTGAEAFKNCPADVATIGQTVTCNFAVANTGDFPATVAALTEQSPFPGGAIIDISCTIAGGTVIDEGDTLAPNTPCVGTFQVAIANDRTLCNTFVLDRVSIDLAYTQFPVPLFAGAFATEVTAIVCPADIEITKVADELSKVGDPVTYTFTICNEGDVTVNRGSVTDTVLGDLTAFFPATLAPDQCVEVVRTRTVAMGDPDPLVNTVTATYTAGSGVFASSDTDTATDSTNLFQPSVGVTKNCAPDPVLVGAVLTCTIVVTNTGSADSPGLVNGTISDTRAGNLLAAGNPNVVSSTCGATLATGASCTIVTRYTVLDTDSSPLVNTVTVNYNPQGFPNEIRATASDSVVVNRRAEISISKEADALSKIGDSVTYTFEICNDGASTVTRGSVTDTLLGDLTAFFPASLAPGQCVEVVRTRTVAAGDPDPLVNTVTATYTAGTSSDTATATDSTNLFQPSVDVTKNCAPDPVDIGGIVTCTIVVTNTSSADSPGFINAAISDTRSGNLLAAGNPAVVSTTCTATLATGASCTIVTRYTVLATDVSPLCNTVTVNYNPMGFPNNITDTATDCVVVKPPPGGEGCTPGFWKQEHHFDSWEVYSPTQTLESVFDVPDELGLDNVTLAEALDLNGGGVNALLRHAVAALLNASSTGVDFDLSTAQVIAATNAALASGDYEAQKDIFAALNEQGCPLS